MIRLNILYIVIIFFSAHMASPMRRATSRLFPKSAVNVTTRSLKVAANRLFAQDLPQMRTTIARSRGVANAHAELTQEPAYILLQNIDLAQHIYDIQKKNSELVKQVDQIKNQVDMLFEQQHTFAPTITTEFFNAASLRAQEHTSFLSHINKKGTQNAVWQAAARCAQGATLKTLKNKQSDLIKIHKDECTFNGTMIQDYYSLQAKREAYLLQARNSKASLELVKNKPTSYSLLTYFSSFLLSFYHKK